MTERLSASERGESGAPSLALLLVLSCIVAILVAFPPDYLPLGTPAVIVGIAGWLGSDAGWHIVAGLGAGLVFFLLFGLFVPSWLDALALARPAKGLDRLLARAEAGGEPTPSDVRAVFAGSPLALAAASYTASLWHRERREDGAVAAWRAMSDPQSCLQPALEQRSAADHVAAALALIVLALGIAGYAAAASRAGAVGLFDGGLLDVLSQAPPPLLLACGLVGLGLALLLGTLLVSFARTRRIAGIAERLRALFPPAGSEFLAQQWRHQAERAASEQAKSVAQARDAVIDSLTSTMEELRAMLATHDRRIAASVASSVQRVVQPISRGIDESLARLQNADETAAQRLHQAVLTEFLGEFQQRYATHLAALGDLLGETRAAAQGLKDAFAQAETRVADDAASLSDKALGSVRDAIAAAAAQQAEALRETMARLDGTVAASEAGIARLAERIDGAIERWTGRTEAVAGSLVERGGDELQRAAAAFAQLHSILETLSVSVLPAINRLVGTQEKLQLSIEADRTGARSMSEAAGDLVEAVRIAREMAERQMQFVRDIAQLSPARAAAGTQPATAPGAPLPGSEALARALADLRAETDDELRSLPQL